VTLLWNLSVELRERVKTFMISGVSSGTQSIQINSTLWVQTVRCNVSIIINGVIISNDKLDSYSEIDVSEMSSVTHHGQAKNFL